MAKFEDAIPTILRHEGKFTNNPKDSGGATNYGISLRYLEELGLDINGDGKVDAIDIRNLSEADAIALYQGEWDALNLFNINDQPVATKTFDISVNMGRTRAVNLLRNAIGALKVACPIEGPGVIRFATTNLVNTLDAFKLYSRLREQQAAYYTRLYNSNPDKFGEFIQGWLNRAYDKI
jgi:lysozyme family protein